MVWKKKIDKHAVRRLINSLSKCPYRQYLIYKLLSINIDGIKVNEVTIDGDKVKEVTVDGDVVYNSTATTLKEGFEDYSTGSAPPSPWVDPGNTDPTVESNSTQWGNKTLRFTDDSINTDEKIIYTSVPSEKAFPIDKAQFAYNEDGSSNTGFTLYIEDSSGTKLIEMGTDNPEIFVVDANGETEVFSSPDPDYDVWRRCTATIDWSTNTWDFLWEDITGNSSDQTYSGSLPSNDGKAAEIGLKEFDRAGYDYVGGDVDQMTRFSS